MNKQTFDQLKKQSAAIELLKKRRNLTEEEKKEYDRISLELAVLTTSIWFPADWTRRILMVIVFLAGLYGVLNINPWFWLLILLSLLFSPRVIRKIAIIIGRIEGNK